MHTKLDELVTRESELVKELEEIKRKKDGLLIKGRAFRRGREFLLARNLEDGFYDGFLFRETGDMTWVDEDGCMGIEEAEEIPVEEFLAAWVSLKNKIAKLEP